MVLNCFPQPLQLPSGYNQFVESEVRPSVVELNMKLPVNCIEITVYIAINCINKWNFQKFRGEKLPTQMNICKFLFLLNCFGP